MIITIKTAPKKIEASEEIGFVFVPDQLRKKSIEKGFYINILVVGRRGLGTSTLINNIFCSPVVDKERIDDISSVKNEIFENNIKLSANISCYHEKNIEKIKKYVENKMNEYFNMEQSLLRLKIDNKIHICIFMIPNDKLQPEEIDLMKELSLSCNLLPIICKADSYTAEELKTKKQNLRKIFLENEISTYIPSNTNEQFNFPLAVIASEDIHEIDGILHRGRMYPWGFIDVELPSTSDLILLRRILIHSYLDDLVNTTNYNYYEKYRLKKLNDERNSDILKQERIKTIKNEIKALINDKNKEIEKDMIYNNLSGISIEGEN